MMDILELLRVVAPEAAAASKGVPPPTVLALERELGITFPQAYRSFLYGLGYDTGGFEALARTHTTNFAELLAELPGPEERVSRYWRISIERDLYKPCGEDFYLDLSTSDGFDAMLVGFGYPPDDEAEESEQPAWGSFFDRVRFSMFDLYLGVRSHNEHYIHIRSGAAPFERVNAIVREILSLEGFTEFVPYGDRFAFFHRSGYTVYLRRPVDRDVSILLVDVNATTREQAALLVEKLRDHIPAKTTVTPPRD